MDEDVEEIDVEDFLQANPVAEKAANILRDAHPDVQRAVIARGSLEGTSNPSGALIGRVNTMAGKLGLDGKGSDGKGRHLGGDNDRARPERHWDEFPRPRHSSREDSTPFAGKGGYWGWDGLKGGYGFDGWDFPIGGKFGPPLWAWGGKGGDDWADWDDFAWGCWGKGAKGGFWGDEFMEPPRKRPRIEEDWWDWGFGKGPAEPDRWRGKGNPTERSSGKGQPRRAVERFLEANGIADKAAMILRDAPPEVQDLVLERGSLLDCRNPSGALVGRVNSAAEQLGMKGGASGKGQSIEDSPGMSKAGKGKGRVPIGAMR